MATPLTKRKKTGELYLRPPAVERAVDEALHLPVASAIKRSMVQDRNSPDYLQSECLVHLIRESRRRDDHTTMDRLIASLFHRCHRILAKRISSSLPNAEDIRIAVLDRLGEYFALDGQKGDKGHLDFFECRFHRALKSLTLSKIRDAENSTSVVAPLTALGDTEKASDETRFADMSEDGSTKANQLCVAMVNEALAAMTKEDRDAFLLVHRMGYKIESNDPREETAATRARVCGRTIRTRLKRAEQVFKKHMEDRHD